jgi:beta-lactamase regulating signal transducer with metallopeptidase domain
VTAVTQTLLHIALSNAAVAAALAVAALAVTVALRRPALSHAAWLLVLLKLLTPPLFTVPVEWPGTAVSTVAPEPVVEQWGAPHGDLSQQIEAGLLGDEPVVDDVMGAQPFAAEEALAPVAVEGPSVWARVRAHRALALVSVWAFGSSMVLVLIASRLYRFRRILRHATPAGDDVQGQVRMLCEDLDIRPAPSVYFVPGGVCPMLIGFGRASRILVPRGLWWHLDENQRATLLVHELAHLRRGDQWIRLIELLVTVAYWWNPVAWFARRELREAEEQCCDAWVVWAMPHSARDYAVALMEAIDLTTRARPVAVPVLGSGMGEFHHLRRRLIMIKQGKVARALTWSGLGAMCGVGALLLPLSPTFAEPERPKEVPAEPFSVVERLDGIEGFAVFEEPVGADAVPATPATPAMPVEPALFGEGVRIDLQVDDEFDREIDGELKEAREEVQQLSKELARAHQRLAQLEQRRHGAMTRKVRPVPGVPTNPMARGPRTVQPRGTPPAKAAPGAASDPAGLSPDKVKPPKLVVPKVAPEGGPMSKGPMPGWEGGGRGDGQEKRLDMLEERLAELLNEVRSLKQQQRNASNVPGLPGGRTPPPAQTDVAPHSEPAPRPR